MSLPTYAEIAQRTASTIPPPTVRATRSGIRKYLMLISDEKVVGYAGPPWVRLWGRIDWVHAWTRSLHIEIPIDLWQEDQARLAAKLAQPDYDDHPVFRREKERALRWTRRRRSRA